MVPAEVEKERTPGQSPLKGSNAPAEGPGGGAAGGVSGGLSTPSISEYDESLVITVGARPVDARHDWRADHREGAIRSGAGGSGIDCIIGKPITVFQWSWVGGVDPG